MEDDGTLNPTESCRCHWQAKCHRASLHVSFQCLPRRRIIQPAASSNLHRWNGSITFINRLGLLKGSKWPKTIPHPISLHAFLHVIVSPLLESKHQSFAAPGRRHQIRSHLAFKGHPVVHDEIFGLKLLRATLR